MQLKIPLILRKIITKIAITQPIVGLELSDSFLRLLKIDGERLIQASLRLPPGIISGGVVKDKKGLIGALLQIHKEIGRKSQPVIATIGGVNVYTQVFSLPYLALNKIEEAATLNLQMISPIDVKNVYSDWQIIGEINNEGIQLELLGAFLRSDIADDYLIAIQAAGFSVAALEFASLSLVRAISERTAGIDIEKPRVILLAGNEGADFIIMKNSNLYFHHFVPWAGDIKTVIAREMQRVMNFYFGKWGSSMENLLLVSPVSLPIVEEAAKGAGVNIIPLNIQIGSLPIERTKGMPTFYNKEQPVHEFSAAWLVALGATLRGLMPRSADILISLTSLGTEKEYYQNRVLYFVAIWRNIAAMIAVTMIIIYGFSFWFLSAMNDNLNNLIMANDRLILPAGLSKLEEQAEEFNSTIVKALKAKDQAKDWADFLQRLLASVERGIVITRFDFNPEMLHIILSGNSLNETDIINFKNRLLKDSRFEQVSLPLSQIVRQGNKVVFQMTLKVKK